MPPPMSGKRKRGDRSWSGDQTHDPQRPSPHRPGNLSLAQQNHGQNHGQYQEQRGRGGRRASRGGRGGYHQKSPITPSNPSNPPSVVPSPALNQPNSNTSRQADMPRPNTSESISGQNRSMRGPPPPPYEYEHVTAEIVDNWGLTGRQELVAIGKAARSGNDLMKLSEIFQELVRSALDARLAPEEVGRTIRDVLQSHTQNDVAPNEDASTELEQAQNLFLDTITVLTDDDTLNPLLPPLLASTEIPTSILREELEAPLLQKVGLIRDTFARMGIRKQTNLLYRQANFNLMREESEGFAKLMTDLFTTSDSEPPTNEVVEDTVLRVKAMIGAFDLDVGRTLDVVLDVFGAVLVKQNRFFVKFLRASPWWPRDELRSRADFSPQTIGGLPSWAIQGFPALADEQKLELQQKTEQRHRNFWERAREVGMKAWYEIGQQQISQAEKERLLNNLPSEETDASPSSDWIRKTGTMPPKGNRDAAQLLGFKLRFYSSSAARNPSENLPDNLIYLSALLIKIGFISLNDLYPHVWRSDDKMDALRIEKEKEKAERDQAARPGASAKNALLMAGALSDDTLPIPSRLRETEGRASTPSKELDGQKNSYSTNGDAESLQEAADQKVPLLQSLLAIGALSESLFILGKFPWLIDLYPEIPEYLHRIMHHSLTKVYEMHKPLAERTSIRVQRRVAETDVPGIPKGQIKLSNAPAKRSLRWAKLDRIDQGVEGTDYRFYWDDWSDCIPICQSADDVFTLCETFLSLSGVKIGQDPSLLLKLARIGRSDLNQNGSDSNRRRWLDLCKRLLVPALSLTKSNPGVVNEIYDLLRNYSRETRYSVYAEWSSGRTSRNVDVKWAFDLARAETRDALKRLSKTNTKPIARTLARIACANPQIVTSVAINQIEAYENLAEVFVEGARYFTDMGYDILTWCLVNSLGRAGRSRVQESGLITSRWLAALAHFASRAFKRYSVLDPTPILQYVGDQLKKGNSTDLILLEQVILSMAGIVTDTNYNEGQILAMGGGELLQAQTRLQLHDKRHESKLTSKRLMRSLKTSGLAGQLLLSIAQERRTCVFKAEDMDAPLKLIGNVFDEIHRVLTQYLDLLRSNTSQEEFQSLIPNVSQLISDYGVQPEIAFWISRSSIVQQISEVDKNVKEDSEKKKHGLQARSDSSEDVAMTSGEANNMVEDGEAEGDVQDQDNTATSKVNGIHVTGIRKSSSSSELQQEAFAWHPALQDIMDSLQTGLGSNVADTVGLPFYVRFWQLALYDISIPSKAYEDEIARQTRQITLISSNRTDISVSATKKKEEEKKQLSDLSTNLLAENRQHLKAYQESKAQLLREKDHWFLNKGAKLEALNTALMEHCFLPRMLLSPVDAAFSFKFLRQMHSFGTRSFRTLTFLDSFFKENRLTSLIFMCTSKEADNFGRFLMELLRELNRWHEKKTVYEKEAFGSSKSLVGFAKKLNADGKVEEFLHYEDFRRILYKWHNFLHLALKTCFISTDYMHIRNAISVLKAISNHYPVINWMGESFKHLVGDLGKSEQGDIKVPSLALMGDLNRREKSWVMPQAFRRGQEQSDANSISRPGSTKPLNAEATEFKPATQPNATTDTSMPKTNTPGEEDGEVQDAKTAVAEVEPSELKTPAPTDTPGRSKPEIDITKPAESQDHKELQTKPSGTLEPKSSGDEKQSSNSRPSTAHHTVPKRPEPSRPPPPSSVAHHPSLPSRPENPAGGRLPPPPIRPPSQPADRRDVRSHDRDRQSRRHDREPTSESDQHTHSYDRPSDPIPRDYTRQEPRDRDAPSRAVDERHSTSSMREPRPPFPDQPSTERFSRSRLPMQDYTNKEREKSRALPEQPSRTASSQSSDTSGVNPDRVALINGHVDRPEMSIKGQAERSRPSRERSPTRRDGRATKVDRRDDMPHVNRRYPSPEQRENIPSGPRNPSDRYDNARSETLRPREIDMNHGRLNQDSSDNHPVPRARSSGSTLSRSNAPPQPHLNIQQAVTAGETSVSSSARPPRRSSLTESNQATPSTPTDASGIHPDRLRNLQSPNSDTSNMRPPPPQNRSLPPTPAQSSPPTAPSGPRGAPPSGPSPTTRGPPSGPNLDTSNRGNRSNRNPLAAVNSHLQQANQGSNGDRGQGMTIRGRGGMRNTSSSLHAVPSSPSNGPGPRSEALSSAVSVPPPRQELFPGRGPPSNGSPSNMPPPRHDDTRRPAPRNGPGPHSEESRFDAPQDGNMPPSRLPSAGRRNEPVDENAYGGRRSTRYSGSSRVDGTDRDGTKRGQGQDDGRRPYERDGNYHDREREGRGEYERDRNRAAYDGHHDPREPPPRSFRRDDVGSGPPNQPPRFPAGDHGRGDSRGYGSGRPSGDERELRNRDREPRELRSSGRTDRDHGTRMSDNPNMITPQKRRGPEDGPDSNSGYAGGDLRSGRGGMYRNPSDNKRPRRGP